MKDLKVMGLNSGLGYALWPFRENVIANIEERADFSNPNNEQWSINYPEVPNFRKIPLDMNFHPDVIISSPNCGGASVFRISRTKKFGNQREDKSLNTVLTWIPKLKPKFFLFENLLGLYNSIPKEEILQIFSDYEVLQFSGPVSLWNNSQISRKRLVLIGIRRDLPFEEIKKYFKLPKAKDLKTCFELYGDLNHPNLSIGNVRESLDTIISVHSKNHISFADLVKFWRSTDTRSMKVEGRNFRTAPGVYRNFNDGYPRTARKSERQFQEDGYCLTPRQLARIMGIPDDFQIYINTEKFRYWIRKGRVTVTKGMVYEIPKWFKSCLKKSQKLWI